MTRDSSRPSDPAGAPLPEDADRAHSTTDWAKIEALRLRAKARAWQMSDEEIARTAARRAPGLKLAAESLHAITKRGNTAVSAMVPDDVKELVQSSAAASTDEQLIARMSKWLSASPHELKRCHKAAAALAAAAPVALVSTQHTSAPRDQDLEEACKQALAAAPREAALHLGPGTWVLPPSKGQKKGVSVRLHPPPRPNPPRKRRLVRTPTSAPGHARGRF